MISITLPSIHPAALQRALANLRVTTWSEYEVIVVSPFEPPYDGHVVWIPETKALGPNAAHAHALQHTSLRSDFVLGWVDDHELGEDWDVNAMVSLELSEQIGPGFATIGLRHADVDHVGTVFGHYYPFFPFMRREVALRFGWYDSGFRRGFADCDLGLRLWNNKGYVTWGARCVYRCADDHKQLPDGEAGYEFEDLQRFLSRWRWKYPGWGMNAVRDFNVDVVPEKLRELPEGTIRFASAQEMWR